MAKLVLNDALVTFNSVPLADHTKSFTLRANKDLPDATTVTSEWDEALSGMMGAEADIEFYQDYAAANVDATVWAAFIGTSAVTVAFTPRTADPGTATNPTYTGSALVSSYVPLGGSHGDAVMAPVSIKYTGALTRTAV